MSTTLIGNTSPLEEDGKGFEAVQVEEFWSSSMAGMIKLDVWVGAERRERLAITPSEARSIASDLLHAAERAEIEAAAEGD